MTTIQFIKDQMFLGHGWFLGIVKGLTDEQANYLPSGTAHPIGAIVQHVLFVEDDTINRRLQGGESIWERDGWGERAGLPNLRGADEAAYRAFRMPAAALDDYRRAVWAASDAYLDTLTEEDLLREMESAGRASSVGAALGIVLNHTPIHVGEISAIKGIQGLRGSPL